MLDLRKPAGIFFGLLGLLLTATALLASPDPKPPLLDVDLNLYFGIFCIAFGGVFLWLAHRA